MYAKLVVIFAFLGVVTSLQTYPLCTDTTSTGTLNDVTIEGCTPDQPCKITPGGTKTFEIDFTPSAGSNSLTAELFLNIAGAWVPDPTIEPEGCLPERNIKCPLVANTKYAYKNQITINPTPLPVPKFQTKFLLTGDNNSPIVCFLVDVEY